MRINLQVQRGGEGDAGPILLHAVWHGAEAVYRYEACHARTETSPRDAAAPVQDTQLRQNRGKSKN